MTRPSTSIIKSSKRSTDLGVTEYSKRVRSKYLLNYYSKIDKQKREASRSHISKDTYSFVHGINHDFKPAVQYTKLSETVKKEEFLNADLDQSEFL